MDNDVLTEEDKQEFVDESVVDKLVAVYAARKICEVKIVWPLADGHTFTIHATRRLSDLEFKLLGQLLRLAKGAFVTAAKPAGPPQ